MTIPPVAAATETFLTSRIALNVETTGLSEMQGMSQGLLGIAEQVTRIGVAGYIAGKQLGQGLFTPIRIAMAKETAGIKQYARELEGITKQLREARVRGAGHEELEKLVEQQDKVITNYRREKDAIREQTGLWGQLGGTIANIGYTLLQNHELTLKIMSDMARLTGQPTSNIEDYYDAQVTGLRTLGTEGAEHAKNIYTELLNLRRLTEGERQNSIPLLTAFSESIGPEVSSSLVSAYTQHGRLLKDQITLLYQLDITEQELGVTHGVLAQGVMGIVNEMRLLGVTTDDVLGGLSGFMNMLGDTGKEAVSLSDALDLVRNSIRAQKSLSFGRGMESLIGMGAANIGSMGPASQAALNKVASSAYGKDYGKLDIFQQIASMQGLSGDDWQQARGDMLQNMIGKSPFAKSILGGKSFTEANNWQVRALVNDPMMGRFLQGLGFDQETLVTQQKFMRNQALGTPSAKPFTTPMANASVNLIEKLSRTRDFLNIDTIEGVKKTPAFREWQQENNFSGADTQRILESVEIELQQASKSSEGLMNRMVTELQIINTNTKGLTGGWADLKEILGGAITLMVSLIQLQAYSKMAGLPSPAQMLIPKMGRSGLSRGLSLGGGAAGIAAGVYAADNGSAWGAALSATGGIMSMYAPHPALKALGIGLAGAGAYMGYEAGKEGERSVTGGAPPQRNLFSRASGGSLPTTGAFMGHQGEFVVPASGLTIRQGRAEASVPGSGGSVTHINMAIAFPSGMTDRASADILRETFGSDTWMTLFTNKVVAQVKPVVNSSQRHSTF